ncbi:MAG: sulfatase-like hydrolase/transferase [Saprospiraceae bacterium]|nr:sulfatase-like hydrolase/transferase [Saprospiraceae bacterium]
MGKLSFARPGIFNNSLVTFWRRLALIFLAYTFCRILFYLFNIKSLGNIPFREWPGILVGGLVFDTSAIAYTNVLFLVLALFPVRSVLQNKIYQAFFDLSFLLVNGACLLLNVIDFYYFEFNLKRITADFTHWAGETNLPGILLSFIAENWFSFLVMLLLMYLFYKLYRRIPRYHTPIENSWLFALVHLALLVVFIGLAIAGMRGGFRHSTRPITLSNAGQYVSRPELMPVVLNTPFSLIRTFDKKAYPGEIYMQEEKAIKIFNPVKNYADTIPFVPKNIVIIILESYSREHSGRLNRGLDSGHYQGYTPFLDSLMDHSLVCTNAFANGRKSIDAMPSILAGIPSLVLPYVLSHNSLNKINSLASLLKPKGYTSGFYHGAPNGSMGFEAFSKIAGFDRYVGMNEYANEVDYDGLWGIWDEEFLQFFSRQLDTLPQPFLEVCFTLSSHHPFKLPARYEGQFPTGKLPVHQTVGYTDMALRKFFESAAKKPWFDQTLFVITADHSTVAWSDQYNSAVGAFAIPLIFYCPGDDLKKFFTPVTQQTDIMPSILDYLHFDHSFIAFGNSIFDSTSSPFALNYLNELYQIIDEHHHLTLFDGKTIQGIFDVGKTWTLSDATVIRDPNVLNHALLFQQAIIQQYNQRILNNQLTSPN